MIFHAFVCIFETFLVKPVEQWAELSGIEFLIKALKLQFSHAIKLSRKKYRVEVG